MSILAYSNALDANAYRIQLKNQQTGQAINVNYNREQLVKPTTMGYLRLQNSRGFDVYCRPIGWQYVLLDDLTRPALAEVARLQPCLLIETSPANYQAWLILPETPTNRDAARDICRALARMVGADPGAADPDHVGRLPGFTNRKEKYRQANDLYPFVQLHKWEHRVSTCQLQDILNGAQNVATRGRNIGSSGSASEKEFGVVCGLLKRGLNEDQIREHLLRTCPDLESRKGRHLEKYIFITIHNARKAMGF